MPRLIVTDPRDPEGEAELPVHFQVRSPGLEPHGYGRDFDPGCGPDIELRFALDAEHVDVLPLMDHDQRAAIKDEIIERFDFRLDGRGGCRC